MPGIQGLEKGEEGEMKVRGGRDMQSVRLGEKREVGPSEGEIPDTGVDGEYASNCSGQLAFLRLQAMGNGA